MPKKRKIEEVVDDVVATKKPKTSKRKDKSKKSDSKSAKFPQSKKDNKKENGAKKSSSSSSSKVGGLILKDLLLDQKWKKYLADQFDQPYFNTLEQTLAEEYNQGKQIFPPQDLIFNALNSIPLDKVKVVILGQDPYHDDGQAMGMSFSVPNGIAVPPSLKNIYKELERDPDVKGFKTPDHGNLEAWAKQGVLLLNATLTVEAHKPNSHAKFGWQKLTDAIIQVVSKECRHVVFILWGGFAQKKEKLIDQSKHTIIKTAHPSPLSVTKFQNCGCFSDCDKALEKHGLSAINWSL